MQHCPEAVLRSTSLLDSRQANLFSAYTHRRHPPRMTLHQVNASNGNTRTICNEFQFVFGARVVGMQRCPDVVLISLLICLKAWPTNININMRLSYKMCVWNASPHLSRPYRKNVQMAFPSKRRSAFTTRYWPLARSSASVAGRNEHGKHNPSVILTRIYLILFDLIW